MDLTQRYRTSSPSAVSWADGRLDIFVRGSDDAVYQKTCANGAWSSWKSLGRQIAPNTSPAASSQATGKLDLFFIGSDNALWHRVRRADKYPIEIAVEMIACSRQTTSSDRNCLKSRAAGIKPARIY